MLLLHLMFQRFQLRNCRVIVGLRVIEVCLADNSGRLQLHRAVQIYFRQTHIGFLCNSGGFLAIDRSFLFQRVDLKQRCSGGHTIARFYEDLGDLTFHLGVDGGGVTRFQDGEILG